MDFLQSRFFSKNHLLNKSHQSIAIMAPPEQVTDEQDIETITLK